MAFEENNSTKIITQKKQQLQKTTFLLTEQSKITLKNFTSGSSFERKLDFMGQLSKFNDKIHAKAGFKRQKKTKKCFLTNFLKNSKKSRKRLVRHLNWSKIKLSNAQSWPNFHEKVQIMESFINPQN